jgi:DNA modification methylase
VDFFWIWESIIVSAPDSRLGSPAAAGVAYIESKGQGRTEIYRQQMLRAFKEIYRVLKPGRKLCLFFTGKATRSFQEYVDLC